jgi:hypothetical protein
MTHRWSLRETDLWNYSLSLQEIDKMRVDGKFVDSEGNRPTGQYVCLPYFQYRFMFSFILLGPTLSAKTMLWPHLPPAFFE